MKKLLNIYDSEEERLCKTNLIKFANISPEYISFQNIHYRDFKDEFIHVTIVDDTNFVNKVR